MADMEKELRDFLHTKWSLTTEGYKKDDDIEFHRGYLTLEQIPSDKKIVQVGHSGGHQTLFHAEGALEGDAVLTVLVMVKAAQDAINDVESAKTEKFAIKDEIERILLKETPLPTNWEYAWVSDYDNKDEPASEPPLMAELLYVKVKYQQTP